MVVIGHFYFVDVALACLTFRLFFANPLGTEVQGSCFRDRREASLLVKKANVLSKSWVSGMGDTLVSPLG